MGRMPQGHVAADTIGGIFDPIPHQIPVKCVLEGIDAFHTMAGHFFPVFMTAGAQFYNFGMGAAPSHAVGKMGVKILSLDNASLLPHIPLKGLYIRLSWQYLQVGKSSANGLGFSADPLPWTLASNFFTILACENS